MASATYTVKQVAELAGGSEWLLYQLIRNDECPFPFIRLGKRIVFPRAAVDAALGVQNLDTVDKSLDTEGAGAASSPDPQETKWPPTPPQPM